MTRRDRELALVVSAALLIALPFLGEAFHVDEPFFLDRARELLSGAAWTPRAWSDYNNNPPVILWLLAAATRIAGENEAALRAALLPLDALAAASLYLLFARFLKKPLVWALLAVLSPAYVLNMGHLMAEKPAMAFSLAAAWSLVKGAEEKRRGWLAASAVLLSASMLSKYASVALLPAALIYLLRSGFTLREAAGYAVVAAAGPAIYLASHVAALGAVATTMAGATAGAWSRAPHRARSVLAFAGGLSVLPLVWPLARARRVALTAAVAAAILFAPPFDAAPVRPLDRALGVWMAAGALAAAYALVACRLARGRDLWLPWAIAAIAVVAGYWSVMARVVLFLLPPLLLGLGAVWEARGDRDLPWAVPAAAACLSLALGWTDFVYAGAQKDMALELAGSGRVVWCAAKLGLRHYLLRAGARPLDTEADWEKVAPGEFVVFARTTTNFRPARALRVNARRRTVSTFVPFRLISGFGGEGGFYSNISGFLPFSLGSEPVEEFTVVESL